MLESILTKHNRLFDSFLIVFFWTFFILLINPVGEFPLNDDWAWSISVKHFLDTGLLRIHNFGSMTLIGQTLWGSLVCSFLGYSFTSLRISTLILSYIIMCCSYHTSRNIGISREKSWIVVLILMSNPIFFSISFSFMTDIHFLAFLALGSYFISCYFVSAQKRYLILCLVAFLYSCSIRQFGFIAIFSLLIYALVFRPRNKLVLYSSAIGLILSFLLMSLITKHIGFLYNGPTNFISFGELARFLFLEKGVVQSSLFIGKNLFVTIVYTGFFIIPFIPNFIGIKTNRFWTISIIAILILVSGILGLYTSLKGYMPYIGNYLGENCIGTCNNPALSFWGIVWLYLTLLSIYCISKFFLIAISFLKTQMAISYNVYSLIFCVLYVLGIATTILYDRYFILILYYIPAISILLLSVKRIYVFSWIFITIQMAFSIIVTKDYINTNKTKWLAINYLNKQIGQFPIGDVQYDALNFFAKNGEVVDNFKPNLFLDPNAIIEVKAYPYIIKNYKPDGYIVIKSFDNKQFFNDSESKFFILKRIEKPIIP